MDKMLNWFTKRRTIIIFLIFSVIFIVFRFVTPYYFFDFCQGINNYTTCSKIFRLFFTSIMISPLIFLSSVILYKIRDNVFLYWKKFTNIYIYIYIL